jgi:hypothetical protein
MSDYFEHYPKAHLFFDEAEFVFIDLFFEIPKFLEELLFELAERGQPFVSVFNKKSASALMTEVV